VNSLLTALAALLRLSGAVLTLLAACLALAAQGGRFSDRLDVLTHFSPIWLGMAVAGLCLWVLAGGRHWLRITPVAAFVGLLAAGGLMAPELTRSRGPAPPKSGETLKLIQFNLWGRAGNADGMVDWIRDQDADILVFEEAFARTGGVARALKSSYPYQISCADPAPCSTMILSRIKPVSHRGLGAVDNPDWLSGAVARFRTPGGEFSVVGVHYTWPLPSGPQQQQTRRLTRVLDTLPRDSAIVAGDFNSTPWSFSLRRQDQMFGLDRRTHALASWPAAPVSRHHINLPFPVLPIDQVYAGEDWKTVSVERGPKLGSDHYPVVVVLRR
jgi:endonuclease/exonuclease/phosphatase (EEP) superfamily protein YafD